MTTEHGPFESEREALATRAAAIIRAAYDAHPGPGASFPEALKVMTDACEETGVVLGGYDLSLLRWLSMWETGNAVSLAGIIRRAYEAGKASAMEGAETEWALNIAGAAGLTPYDETVARRIVQMMREHGVPVGLYGREVGPWKEVPDE